MKLRITGMALLLLGMFINVLAQERHEFSAKDAVEYAKKNSAQVKNALLDVLIQEQTNREVTAAAYPQISASLSGTGYIKLPTTLLPGEFFGQPAGTHIPVKFGTKFNESAGLSLQQLLFDGQVFIGLQAREATMNFARKAAEVTEINIIANVYKIYYQLAASKSQLSILDANTARVEKFLSDTRKLYENGFAEKLDISKLEVQLANLKTEKQKAQNSIDNGYLGLKVLMGMPIRDSLVLTEAVNEADIRNGILDAAAYNYNDRKEYQYAQLGKTLNEYNIRRYKLSKLPTVSLNAAYNTNRQDNKFGFGAPWFKTSYVGLSVNFGIFSGGAKDARIHSAQLELQKTQNNLDALKLSIDNDVRQAINNYNTALATLDAQKRNMDLAETVYNQTQLKFQNGVGSQTEISTAQSDLLVAQNNYILSLYDAINARIDFLKATGKLQ
jgi:outer membrane protein TolC